MLSPISILTPGPIEAHETRLVFRGAGSEDRAYLAFYVIGEIAPERASSIHRLSDGMVVEARLTHLERINMHHVVDGERDRVEVLD